MIQSQAKNGMKLSVWLLVGAVVTSLVLIAALIWWQGKQDNKSQPEIGQFDDRSSSSIGNSPSNATEDSGPARGREQPPQFDSNRTGAETELKHDSALPVKQAFSYERPIVAALEEAALNQLLTYDQMMSNLAAWKPLCTNINGFGNQRLAGIELDSENNPLKQDLESFCQGFTKTQQEHIDESLDVTSSNGGLEPIQALREDPLNRSNPDLSIQAATRALVDSIERYDYATTIEIVWYMGVELPISIEESADPSPLVHVSSDPEVLLAVGAAVFCQATGNCDGRHPIPIGLCFTFPERPCKDNIMGIHDAIDQILTGSELDQFVAMYDWLQGLIARHRAGDF